MATSPELVVILTQIETRLRAMTEQAHSLGCSMVKDWAWVGPPDDEPSGGLLRLPDSAKEEHELYELQDSTTYQVETLIDDYADEIAGLISILENGGG